jgi:hypothetical protein
MPEESVNNITETDAILVPFLPLNSLRHITGIYFYKRKKSSLSYGLFFVSYISKNDTLSNEHGIDSGPKITCAILSEI